MKTARHPNLAELGTPKLVWAASCCWRWNMLLAFVGFVVGTVLSLVALVGGDLAEMYAGYLGSPELFAEFAEASIDTAKAEGRKSRLSDSRVSESLETCLVHDGRLGASWGLPNTLRFCTVIDFSRGSMEEAQDLDPELFADLVYDADVQRGLAGENFLYEDSTGLLPAEIRLTSADRGKQGPGTRIHGLWGYLGVLNEMTGDEPPWSFSSLAEPYSRCESRTSGAGCRLIGRDLPTDLQTHQAYGSASVTEAFRVARLKEKFWGEPFTAPSPPISTLRGTTAGGEDLVELLRQLLPQNATEIDGTGESFHEWVRRVVTRVHEEHGLLALQFNAGYKGVTEGVSQAMAGPLERGRVVMRTLDCSSFKPKAWKAVRLLTTGVVPACLMAGLCLCLAAMALAALGKMAHGLWRKALFRFDAAVSAYKAGLDWRQAASEYARGRAEKVAIGGAEGAEKQSRPPGAVSTF